MILVVDDDASVQKILKTVLESHGYQIILANNGREALELLIKREDIKLMLLDLLMPELSGTELLNLLPQHNINIPTIVLTGFIDEMKQIIHAKPLSILTKPFDFDLLIAEIERGLNAEPPEVHT